MRADLYTKVVLAVIAIALCVIALPRLEAPLAMAASVWPAWPQADDSRYWEAHHSDQLDTAIRGSRALASTYPLRWWVSWVAFVPGSADTWCSTAIVVTNTTGSAVDYEIEWRSKNGSSQGVSSVTFDAHRTTVHEIRGATDEVESLP
jgi:hypothetical protein